MKEALRAERLEKVRRLVYANAPASDSLERAEAALKGYASEEMDSDYGQSGETCRSILDEYRTGRREWQALCDFVKGLT